MAIVDMSGKPRGSGTQALERGLELLEMVAREPMRAAALLRR